MARGPTSRETEGFAADKSERTSKQILLPDRWLVPLLLAGANLKVSNRTPMISIVAKASRTSLVGLGRLMLGESGWSPRAV